MRNVQDTVKVWGLFMFLVFLLVAIGVRSLHYEASGHEWFITAELDDRGS